ncbi:MAG: hypothetical protein AAB515_00245 [Patescibacteria group bacterium]
MPNVLVQYRVTEHGTPSLLLKADLARIVANRLNVGEASPISCDDVTVVFQKFGFNDVHKRDVVIQVTAHDFPDRVREHKAITEAIADDIVPTLKNFSFGVIVNLTPLEWAAREPKM